MVKNPIVGTQRFAPRIVRKYLNDLGFGRKARTFFHLLVVVMSSLGVEGAIAGSSPPYPPSDFNIEFLTDTYYTPVANCVKGRAPACLGDNWPTTAVDGGYLTVWGDGVGPSGRGRDGADVSLGVARLDSRGRLGPDDERYLGAIKDQRCRDSVQVDGRICGKSYGIAADGETVYMWVSPGSGSHNYRQSVLFVSEDVGRTWRQTQVRFTADRLIIPTFVQFPPDYRGQHRDYFLVIGAEGNSVDGKLSIQRPGAVVAYRVAKKDVLDRDSYERLGVVFEDPKGGVGWTVSASFDTRIDRFILMTEHGQTMQSRLGVFESESLSGPWKTVAYYDNWAKEIGLAPHGLRAFHWNVLGLVADDRFRVVFSGIGNDDTFQSVVARWRRRK